MINIDLLYKYQNEKDYESIIKILENYKHHSLETALLLAHAYNQSAIYDRDQRHQKAIQVLFDEASSFMDDVYWNMEVGYAFMKLHEEGEAIIYFERALYSIDENLDDTLYDQAFQYYEACMNTISIPIYECSLKEAIETMWIEFEENEKTLYQEAFEYQDSPTGLKSLFYSYFKYLPYYMYFSIKVKDKIEITIGNYINHQDFYLLDYLKKTMPNSLVKRWKFIFGIPAKDFEIYIDNDQEIDLNKLYISIEQKENQCLLKIKKDNQYMYQIQLVKDIVRNLIGEINEITYIQEYVLVDDLDNFIPLSKLKEAFNELGYNQGNLELLMEPRFDYRYFPETSNLRANIKGATSLLRLQKEYENDENDLIDTFHQEKIVAGFLMINSYENQEIFYQYIQSCIEDNGYIIGYAFGKDYFYLDIITYDIESLFDHMEEHSDHIIFKNVDFHTFRKIGNTVRIIENKEEYLIN